MLIGLVQAHQVLRVHQVAQVYDIAVLQVLVKVQVLRAGYIQAVQVHQALLCLDVVVTDFTHLRRLVLLFITANITGKVIMVLDQNIVNRLTSIHCTGMQLVLVGR